MPSPKWTVEETEQLKTLWGNTPLTEISKQLGRSINSINHKASRLGITKRKARWTEAEIEFLSDNWGKYRLDTLCKKLNRSRNGVIDMAVRILQLGPSTQSQGRLTARCLADTLGVCNDTVLNWIKRHGLKARLKATHSIKKVYQIEMSDFWKWAEANQHRFDSMRFEKNTLGPEPAWMRDKRRDDFWKNRES